MNPLFSFLITAVSSHFTESILKQIMLTLFSIAAEFSINQSMYTINEQDGEVEICVELSGRLDRPISLELTVLPDTADVNDFDSNILTYTFPSNSVSGSTVCNVVGIIGDGIVENRERIGIELHGNPQDLAVTLILSEAEIFIEDSPNDCKGICYASNQSSKMNLLLSITVVEVDFVETDFTASEGSTLSVCLQLIGSLERNVLINVSTSPDSASSQLPYTVPSLS